MKKNLVLAAFAVLGFSNVNAQHIKFGAKGGFNFASVNGTDTKGKEVVTSFNLGVLSEIPVSSHFSFQPELMYSGQGFSFMDQTIALSYINVPLMGKYYVAKGFSVEAGPQLGFLFSAKNEEADVKDSFKSFDFGVNFGLGYQLKNGLNFGARYHQGLIDIQEGANSPGSMKNSVYQLSVGYFFE